MMHVLGIVPRGKSVVFAVLHGGSYQREVYSRPPYNLGNTFLGVFANSRKNF